MPYSALSQRTLSHQEQAHKNPLCCLLRDLRNAFEHQENLSEPSTEIENSDSESSEGKIACHEEVARLLSTCDLSLFGSKYIHFDPHRYTRVLVAVNKYFSLIINCWNGGQKTPPHNHGDRGNVAAWVHVLQGKFKVATTEEPICESVLEVGETKKLECSFGNHQSGNADDTAQCITLHLYSPPYLECCFTEPHGENCTCTEEERRKFLPVIHCNDREHYYQASEELETMALLKSRPIYGNFRKMVEMLRKEIIIEPNGIHTPENVDHIKGILSCFSFHPKEWEQYAKFAEGRYTRNLIAYDEKFTILLLCWEKGQLSPVHDHAGSNCWVKVLDGEIEESLYDLGDDGVSTHLKSRRVVGPGGIAYINDSYGVHKMGNARSDKVAISLHVYSPAYHECFIFGEEEPMKKKVSISTAYGARYPFMEKKLEDVTTCNQAGSSPDMRSFMCQLDKLFTCVDVNSSEINELIERLSYTETQWENYIHFSPDQYTRNLLGFTHNYSAVLACWCPGQQTPIHEHGDTGDRRVWIKVLTGTLKIQFFEESFNQMIPSTRDPITLKEGEFVAFQDKTLGQHRTFNASSEENCISLHIYSPPYVECTFMEKSGDVKLIPVAYCSEEINQDHFRAHLQEEHLEMEVKFRSMVFTDLASFSNLINKHFDNDDLLEAPHSCEHSEVAQMLSHIQFHPDEWRSRIIKCHESSMYTRNLVAYGYNYSIHLIYWEPEQGNVIHDHNESWSFFKVLEGTLLESSYDPPADSPSRETKPIRQRKTRTLTQGDVVIRRPGEVHRLANPNEHEAAYSLHIYSPPLKQCTGYNSLTGEPGLYSCKHHLAPKA